jgi:hypothetical protein
MFHIDDLIEPCPEKIILPAVSPLLRKHSNAPSKHRPTERITFFPAAQFASFSEREPHKLAKAYTSKLWIKTPIQCVTRTSPAT